MPVMHEYKNDPGCYILAMPSDTGNITYQVSRGAEKHIKELGYGDGDEVPWTVINVFRRIEEIYTKGGGTNPNEVSLELDSEFLGTLSLEQKWKLVTYILKDDSLTDEEKVEMISEILTSDEWEKFVRKIGDGEEKLPEKVEKAIQEHGMKGDEEYIRNGIAGQEEAYTSIQQFYEHPWKMEAFSYPGGGHLIYIYEKSSDEAGLEASFEVVDYRHVEDADPILDIPGNSDDIDFEFLTTSTVTSCTLHVRNGYILLPEHWHVPEEDKYQHSHLRDSIMTYHLCSEFFQDLDSYQIKDPSPSIVEP